MGTLSSTWSQKRTLLSVSSLTGACATLLLSEGVHPKLVQEMLGHATISITLDLYSHVTPMMQEKTAQAMEEALA